MRSTSRRNLTNFSVWFRECSSGSGEGFNNLTSTSLSFGLATTRATRIECLETNPGQGSIIPVTSSLTAPTFADMNISSSRGTVIVSTSLTLAHVTPSSRVHPIETSQFPALTKPDSKSIR